MKARAKHDVRILMEDGRFSNFKQEKEYRCMLKGNSVILIDENGMGFLCDTMEDFRYDFELVN